MIFGISGMIFAATACLFVALGFVLFKREVRRIEARRRRVEELGPKTDAARAAAQSLMRDQTLSSIPLLDRLLSRLPRLADLRLLLHQAGDPFNLGTLVLMCAVAGAVGALAGGLRGHGFMVLALAALGIYGPYVWLKMLRKRRLKAFEEQFPEAVDLVGRALRAGHSFGSAMKMVADEMDDPVSEEFGRVFADYSYGKSMEDALSGMVGRIGLQDVKFFATAVGLQRETGGNLTEILDNISSIIRERFRLLRQLKALSAEGRLSGTILILTAPALLGILMMLSPEYIQMLFDHPTGNMMLMVGGTFQLLGIVVIRRLVKMDV